MKRLIQKFAFWLLDITKNQLIRDELQILKEIKCVEEGHIWRSEFDRKHQQSINTKTRNRVYCVRCGQKYHEHVYKS